MESEDACVQADMCQNRVCKTADAQMVPELLQRTFHDFTDALGARLQLDATDATGDEILRQSDERADKKENLRSIFDGCDNRSLQCKNRL